MPKFKLTRKTHYQNSGVQWRGVPLTYSDIRVLTCLAKGYSNIDSIEILGIGACNFSRRCQALVKKLALDSRSKLVALLIKDNFLMNIQSYKQNAKQLPLRTYRRDVDE